MTRSPACWRPPASTARSSRWTCCGPATGDAFSAGFIAGICRGWDPRRAAELGTAAAALVAQGLGSDAVLTDFGQAASLLTADPPAADPPAHPWRGECVP